MIWNGGRDTISLEKGDTRVEIVRICIVWGFDLKRYPDSTGTLDSHR